MHLNRTGERKMETRDEPPAEYPTLVRDAVGLVVQDFPIQALCQHLGVYEHDLRSLLSRVSGEDDETAPASAPT
jgi:hypothetical protein